MEPNPLQNESTLQAQARAEFEALIKTIRPRLHRYCARMTGSVLDAEDVVQDALAKAFYLLPSTEVINLEAWLFRIAHNKAIDHLRAARSSPIEFVEEYPEPIEEVSALENEGSTTLAVSVFLKLTPMQRSCVIFKDVFGYSLAEIAGILESNVGSVKAALHRGRGNLRSLAKSARQEVAPVLNEPEASLLGRYVACFNARDFDAVRAMLADDVHLDLVEKTKKRGVAEVGSYFNNYEALDDWQFRVGFVGEQPAILVCDRAIPDRYLYVILLKWARGEVVAIRDYRYARWVMTDAPIVLADSPDQAG